MRTPEYVVLPSPVKIGDKKNVQAYAATLTEGQEQLLVTRDGGMFITDGQGGYKIIKASSDEINLSDYLDKTTYDSDDDGIVDKAKTLEGLTKTVDELNKSLLTDSLIAGDDIEIIKNTDDTITITSTASSRGMNLKSLPTFSSKR